MGVDGMLYNGHFGSGEPVGLYVKAGSLHLVHLKFYWFQDFSQKTIQ